QAKRTLKRKLVATERRAKELYATQQQILSSRSWKLTAPLRGFRTLLGAPPPLDLGLGDVAAVEGEAQVRLEWDSLVPLELPDDALAFSPDEAARSNEVCEILRLDWMMEGLLPDALLGQCASAQVAPDQLPTPIYHGTEPSPPQIAFLGSPELATELAFDAAV